MQFVAKILARPRSNRLFSVLLWMPRPLQKSFEQEIVAVKDKELTLKLMLALAHKSSDDLIEEMWLWYNSHELSWRLGV